MAKISNVEVFGLERAFKTAKYPKSVDIKKLNSDLTPGIRACLMCPTGHVGCHAECERYREARAALDEKNKVRRRENASRELALEYTINDMRRKKKERTKK